jgi:antitoxin component YwqK of YwqJK toxin-antitoxin module
MNELIDNLKEGYWEYGKQKISSCGYYKNNLKCGMWKTFQDTGILASKGNYLNGLYHGLYERFHRNGIISTKYLYHYDIILYSAYYDKAGICYLSKINI